MVQEISTNICRLCLTENGDFQSIFMTEPGLTIMPLSEMIMAFSFVQITTGDGLPEQICTTCAKDTIKSYFFKLKCEDSDKELRNRLEQYTVEEKLVIENENQIDFYSIEIKSETNVEDFQIHQYMSDHSYSKNDYNGDCELNNKDPFADIMEKYKCLHCAKQFKGENELEKHNKTHLDTKAFKCDASDKIFTHKEKDELEAHMQGHIMKSIGGVVNKVSIKKSYTCDICHKGFCHASYLRWHKRTHTGEKPFLCSTCGKSFTSRGNLQQHKVRHSGVKPHICNICTSGFATKGELSTHTRKHTGARPFRCSVCSRAFTTSSSLVKHMRIHTGETPYECNVCEKKFRVSTQLAQHKRTHEAGSCKCPRCGNCFATLDKLNKHERIAHRGKLYECNVCKMLFRYSDKLEQHKWTQSDNGVTETSSL